jgi:photosystem II stability/assembly factor-like uncharacterized protein
MRKVILGYRVGWLAVVLAIAGLAVSLPLAARAASSGVSPEQLTSALHWRSVGPYVGGRVTSVAGVADQPNLFYMATAGGGVWETENAGHTWKNISDKDFKTGNIGAIAVAPSNPKIIYAGAGDSAPRNTVLTAGGGTGGIYKSTDGGKNWTHLGLRKTNVISWIEVDPHDANIVYAAALGHLFAANPHRGVFKSTDGGKTWKRVLYVNDQTGAITLAMDPNNPQVLYASMWQLYRRPWVFSSGGPGSGIYKTTDGGAHWTNITHNSGLPSGIFGKVGVAVAPSDPNVVYALVQANYKPGHPGGLFRSDNGGQSWKLMNDSLDITQRAYYYMRVYVDPKDANTIYLPNVGVFVSHDSGKTLTALHPPHGDNHAFWINPNNPKTLIEGNDGGATVSLDGGKTWSTEDNQPTGQFYHANLDNQFPFHIYGAQQDEGSMESANAVPAGKIPPVWNRVQGGEECWVVPVPTKPWITYSCGYFSLNYTDNRKTGAIRNVSPWPANKQGSGGDQIKYRFGWIHHPAAASLTNPNEFLLGANVVFKTTDQGVNWKIISPDLTRNDKSKQKRSGGPISKDVTGEEMYDTISAIKFSPLSNQIIWVGSDDGLVHVTTDGGGHWHGVRPPNLPKWSIISSIDPSHTQKGTAYLAASRYMWDDFKPYVYKTTDYGKHWTKITDGLPGNEYVESVRQDPNDPSLLLAGTSSTVYMSLDDGSHWMPLRVNLPTVRVEDIQFQPKQNAVVLATFGRAYWVLDNLKFLEQLGSAQIASSQPYLFKPQQTWLVKRRLGSFFGPSVGGENKPVGASVFFHLPADYHKGDPVKLSFTTADGKLVRSFDLPLKPHESHFARSKHTTVHPKPAELHSGMNHFRWDLRYPTAVHVTGLLWNVNASKQPLGPEVVPGTYEAVLTYGGKTQKQPFVVKLDPRLHVTQAAMEQRLHLLLRIHTALNQLDTTLNHALQTRSALQQAMANGNGSGNAVKHAYASLNKEIEDLVQLKIRSSEGGLVFRGQLHAWLTSINQQIGMQFAAPTPSMVEVANMYIKQANAGVKKLQSDIAHAKSALQ